MYLGFAVLDLSKWKMYGFHYQYMKPKFPEKLLLNYMDTDSFIYTIKVNKEILSSKDNKRNCNANEVMKTMVRHQ